MSVYYVRGDNLRSQSSRTELRTQVPKEANLVILHKIHIMKIPTLPVL